MPSDKNANLTRRNRLKGHDYAEPGYYLLTFVTWDRQYLLGEILEEHIHLSPTGQNVLQLVEGIPTDFPQAKVDCFAIMPDHVHLLLYLRIDMEPLSISEIIRRIKGRSAAMHRNHKQRQGGLWQKGFHDVIIRNDVHLDKARKYVAENRFRWGNEEDWW